LTAVSIARIIGWLSCAVLLTPAGVRAEDPPRAKRVLLLHQAGVGGPIRPKFDAAFVEALRSDDSVPIDLYEEAIETERFPGAEQARLLREYLKNKYADRKIDVIVAQGIRPLTFARENRELFGDPPIVTTVAPAGELDTSDNIIGLQGGFWIDGTIDLAQTLLPDTCCVFVVDGTRDNNGDVEAEVRRRWKDRNRRLRLVYLRDLVLRDLLSRIAAIPEHSVVLFVRQTMRNRLQDLDEFEGLAHVLAASPVPVFTQIEEFMGRGVVGGYIWRFETDARRMAEIAKLLARGTRPRDIPPGRNTYTTMLDWHQLERWHISESRVPAAALVLFREQSFFELYRRYVVGGLIVFAAQLVLIVGLLAERAWRRRAEAEARRTRDNLAHLTRVSAMGELAASLAHELNQPLTGILCNARAATHLLASDNPQLPELKEILQDIVSEDKRASDIISRMRDLVSKRASERTPVDVNEIVLSMTNLVTGDSRVRQVSLGLDLAADPLMIEGDRVQIQQVVLNLLLNAIEAASSSDHLPHEVVIKTDASDRHSVHVIVRDNGIGLPEGPENQVFEPFYTTKASGMGMGLSIARSIVESHAGTIWATNHNGRGAEFHVTLPRLEATGTPGMTR
jgi:signal transduction histidine kinase